MSATAPDHTRPEDHDAGLVAAATVARDRSYAPYSQFHMGAAVRCADGTIVPGALVENVSLGLAMCAERAALFAAVAQGLQPVALALVAQRTSGELTFPCGACLQVGHDLPRAEALDAVYRAANHRHRLLDRSHSRVCARVRFGGNQDRSFDLTEKERKHVDTSMMLDVMAHRSNRGSACFLATLAGWMFTAMSERALAPSLRLIQVFEL